MNTRGFTAIELLMVVAIAGVLLAIALPSFAMFIADQRVKNAAGDLQATFLRARSEAVSHNATISVAPVSGDWAKGWQVANPSVSGVLIDHHEAPSNVTVSTTATAVDFNNVGRLGSAAASFDLGSAGTATKRCVSVDLFGRPKVKKCACSASC